ncbi:MAG: tyrosine-type recombinase/integrase [Solirubrobacterales bacterium]
MTRSPSHPIGRFGGRSRSEARFATKSGRRPSKDNLRTRVFNKAVDRARDRLAEDGGLWPDKRITPHSMRRTFMRLMLAIGVEVPLVMAEVGHEKPATTLTVYANVMRSDEGEKTRLRNLLEGGEFRHEKADESDRAVQEAERVAA